MNEKMGTYHVDQLWEPQTHFDGESIRIVAYGPNQSIVIAQKIVI